MNHFLSLLAGTVLLFASCERRSETVQETKGAEPIKAEPTNMTTTLETTGLERAIEAYRANPNEQNGAGVDKAFAELDLEIHRTIWSLSDNEFLVKTLSGLLVPLFAHRVIRKLNVEQQQWGQNTHLPFLQFVRGESQKSAETVVLEHLRFGWVTPEKYSHLGVNLASTE